MEHPWGLEAVPGLVPEWSPVLARAVPYTDGSHTLEDAWLGALEGAYQVWTGERSVMLTRTVLEPEKVSVHIFLAAGDMEELIHALLPPAERWARSLGATEMTLAGRRGWARALQEFGYGAPPLAYLVKRL